MPEPYTVDSERALDPGDVVMVERKMRDKRTNKPFLWRFFMVVTEPTNMFADDLTGWVIGVTSEHLKTNTLVLHIDDDRNTIHYLPQDEWPDGVFAFRLQLILSRKVEIL